MSSIRDWVGDFEPGEFLGTGLDTRQIGHLAAALFLALFGLSALGRVRRAGGPWPAVWIVMAVSLMLGGLLVAGDGFSDQVPEDLRPWTVPDRLLRAAAVLCLLACSLVFLSAYWLRNPVPRLTSRAVGVALIGTAVWLAAGWFGDLLPDDARPWAARAVVTRALAVLGLVLIAVANWWRPPGEAPHKRWANRILVLPAAGAAVLFAGRWFGRSAWPDLPVDDIGRVTVILAAVGTGTCAFIASGAYVLREGRDHLPARLSSARRPAAARPLPVAVMLDEQGRPVLPAESPQHRSTGA